MSGRPNVFYDAFCVLHSALDIVHRAAQIQAAQSHTLLQKRRTAVKFPQEPGDDTLVVPSQANVVSYETMVHHRPSNSRRDRIRNSPPKSFARLTPVTISFVQEPPPSVSPSATSKLKASSQPPFGDAVRRPSSISSDYVSSPEPISLASSNLPSALRTTNQGQTSSVKETLLATASEPIISEVGSSPSL
jgi:hypothetical protein